MKTVQLLCKATLVGLLCILGAVGLTAQVVLYEENMGVPSSATLVQNYTGWQQTDVHYCGDGTCDVRTSNASSGYGQASGGGNVMINDSVKWFQVSGINTLLAVSPRLYMGLRKTTAEDGRALMVQASSDSLVWITLSMVDSLPVGTGTSGWYRVSYVGLPVCERLHLRFSNLGTSDFRIDDLAIVDGEEVSLETVATPSITPSSGTYYEPQSVSFASATNGAHIYYTLDGSTPTSESSEYSAPFIVSQTTTLKAFAAKQGMYDSEVATVRLVVQDTNSLVVLPFDISTNSVSEHEDITLMGGFRGYSLGSSYADGSAKFEAAHAGNASLVAHLDSSPELLSFDLKGKTGGAAPASYEGIQMEVSESSDGQHWSIVAVFSESDISVADYVHFTGMSLQSGTRYVRWRLASATKGNTQLNNIVITKSVGQSDSTGVSDYMHCPIALYPNPTSDYLRYSDGGMTILSMALTDICGQEVKSWTSPLPSRLSLTDLRAGTYVLSIVTSEGVVRAKVVKY